MANFIWNHRKSSQNDTDVSLAHNYTLCYARERSLFTLRPLPINAENFTNPDNDSRGPWVADPFDAPNIRPNLTYPITNPNTGKDYMPPVGRCWRFTQDKFNDALADNRIVFGKRGTSKPQYKRFLSEAQDKGKNTLTIWDDVDTATAATKELMSIFDGAKVFSTPKPVSLIERIVKIACPPDSIILDFFAGSGTTAHAVAKLNAEDGGARRFILVSSTEATAEAPDKNLCRDVCAERVRRVLGGYTNAKGEAVAGLGGGFAYLRARRIAPHRLALKLEHAEVWQALQLIHRRALTPWPGGGLAVDGALAYLADFREPHVEKLRDWLTGEDHPTIYCWAPDRVRALAPEADWQPIPQALRARFGR